MLYEDLCNLYSNQVLTEKSTEAYQQAEDYFMRCDCKEGLASVANCIGWNYLFQGDTRLLLNTLNGDWGLLWRRTTLNTKRK